MLRLTSNIEIQTQAGRLYTFDFVTDVRIESGWDQLTATAEVVLPSSIRTADGSSFFSGPEVDAAALFSVGDQIDINLGYDGDNLNEFSGYITTIVPGLPVRLICEDGMWQLKRRSIIATDPGLGFQNANNVGLTELLNNIFITGGLGVTVNINPGVTELQNIKLGKFRISGEVSLSQILERLKDYGLAVFFRGRSDLYVLPPTLADVEPLGTGQAVFNFRRNVIQDDRLQLVTTEQKKKTVLAVSIDAGTNEKTQFPESTNDGDNVTKINFPENLSGSDLEFYANAKKEQEVFNGFEGSFYSFGQPFTRHGETIQLIDADIPERNGFYLVKKTFVRFGGGGFRRTVYPWREAIN